ncbi:enoyl-CoA hydratase/isomerase family protein [Aspergillus nomiae NRRL 13137]|uniref:Enoyl-CoA hydratase/isomerase family protein n=1 Tax=Aspergillus nomiae NRRL (strain ATCC 15546 / NRRL 13137 / CBS 260.88 / M93) TaxID=1509407 RepID=A0A0L1IUI8_ASPN3|nr:enoyl-CoA hydratase/isomerase family protein [Aspergillus nomiae NRRL 13137]KNG83162.1 enoyl-CoA hydratase/isomerase family protein [Aspergillus nomiae NRRL 13137]
MSNQDYKYFRVTIPEPWIAHVEINRPGQVNAFLEDGWREMRTVFDHLSTDPSVRAIVFSGSGEKGFSVGIDLKWVSGQDSPFMVGPGEGVDPGRRAVTQLRRFGVEFQECISSIEKCEKPVICAMHGYALGMAMDVCSATDMRICSKDTVFCVKEVDIGIASDIGILARLPKVVGSYTWVKDVAMSGRNFDADEALRVGFVSRVLPTKKDVMQEAFRVARNLSEKSPVAVQTIKHFLDYSRDRTVPEGLQYQLAYNVAAVQTRDVPVAISSMVSKKKPVFGKL